MVVNGWTLLFHEAIIGQVKNLADAYERARIGDPKGFRSNANIKLLAALAKLVLEIIPGDPSRPEYRQGNTLGGEYRHAAGAIPTRCSDVCSRPGIRRTTGLPS